MCRHNWIAGLKQQEWDLKDSQPLLPQNCTRSIPCMRLGTFICAVTTPNEEFVGLVFGGANVT